MATALTKHATAQSAEHRPATTAEKKGMSVANAMLHRRRSPVTAAVKSVISRANVPTLALEEVQEEA